MRVTLQRSNEWMIVLVALASICPLCSAFGPTTPWDTEFEDPFRSQVTIQTIDMIKNELSLSDAQRQAINEAFQSHQERFRQFVNDSQPKRKEFDQRLADLRRNGRIKEYIEVRLEREEILADIADKQHDLDKRFFESIQPYLTDQQLKQWPDIIHRYNRQRWLGPGIFGEENIDVIAIVEDLRSSIESDDKRKVINELLKQYGNDLDKALRAMVEFEIEHARHFDRSRADRLRPGKDGRNLMVIPTDSKEFKQSGRKKIELRENVCDINRKYRDRVLDVLPEELHQKFLNAYYHTALGGRMQMSKPPSRAFLEDVCELEALSNDQREAIVLHEQSYTRRVNATYEEMVKRQHEYAKMEFWGSRGAQMLKLEEQLIEMLEKRYKYERQFIKNVWSLLSAKQQKQVQKPEVSLDEEKFNRLIRRRF